VPALVLASMVTLVALIAPFAVVLTFLRTRNNLRSTRWARLEAAWNPRIMGLVSGEATAEELVPLARRRDRRFILAIAARFASRLAGKDRDVVEDFARTLIPTLLRDLGSRRPEVRARAVKTIALLSFDDHVGEVLVALDDDSPLVGMVAARALARHGGATFISDVLSHLHRFAEWNPEFVSTMLASVGHGVAPPMRRMLLDPGQHPLVRRVIADALRLLPDPVAGDGAAWVLSGSEERELQAACLRLLAVVGRPDHVWAIEPYLHHPDFALRAHAVTAFGQTALPRHLPAVESLLDDPSPWVALRAAEALAIAGELGMLEERASLEGPAGTLAREVLELAV